MALRTIKLTDDEIENLAALMDFARTRLAGEAEEIASVAELTAYEKDLHGQLQANATAAGEWASYFASL